MLIVLERNQLFESFLKMELLSSTQNEILGEILQRNIKLYLQRPIFYSLVFFQLFFFFPLVQQKQFPD